MRTTLVFALLLAWAGGCLGAEKLTEKCSSSIPHVQLVIDSNATLNAQINAALGDPSTDPGLYERLWHAKPFGSYVSVEDDGMHYYNALRYDDVQDATQIRDEIAADPVLIGRGLRSVTVQPVVSNLSPPPASRTLTEYRNLVLDHYFLSSSPEENTFIDSGGAGPGWERTGETMVTSGAAYGGPDAGYGVSVSVHRFYGPGSRSHVFTPDPVECGILRKPGTGWLREGIAFAAWMPANGVCPLDKKPVWRLYNNRAAQDDSNHRYVAKLSLASEMQLRGWTLEGVAFCVNP